MIGDIYVHNINAEDLGIPWFHNMYIPAPQIRGKACNHDENLTSLLTLSDGISSDDYYAWNVLNYGYVSAMSR